MEYLSAYLMAIIESGGLFAPLLFIGFHLLRPIFFLPVVFICISGGIIFGAVAGTLYSIIGITLSSLVFYRMAKWMPKTVDKLVRMKQKLVGDNSRFTTSQVALLRLVPFIHFHLLSLCILEISVNFKEYMRSSFISNIPMAILYTSVGKWISSFSPVMVIGLLLALLPCIYLLRRKEISIKWEEFFNTKTVKTDA
ncbi:TVP38/TMEM64 family protein [Aquibacillus rhizosphaerae]|uniref:TVP38/TMEM64 family membrane protein n=1 Tax=Aquibacillus rhizosphaerae TaxID=3051431 RepID=A0ABT7L605_9BACI|nr:VTT domain-containing protein [Aquibacillus sp. LR5S19]MDL4840637.1 VTT domain-containing protein [Aquibacillus sp. LR5S19]